MKNTTVRTNYEKEFLDRFNTLCRSRNSWQVWSDVITTMACALANSVNKENSDFQKREDEYKECIERLGGVQVPSEMFALMTMALDENPEQDFLGSMFMKLELGSHWKGQFFTPYNICKLMAEINCEELATQIEEKGWVSVNDCACGAGATLIGMVNAMRLRNVNFQNHALFVAQDIDRVAAMMCFIQLSLLGCSGYVVVADTLTNPLTGSALQPTPNENQEIWYTPMFYSDVWTWRRVFNSLK